MEMPLYSTAGPQQRLGWASQLPAGSCCQALCYVPAWPGRGDRRAAGHAAACLCTLQLAERCVAMLACRQCCAGSHIWEIGEAFNLEGYVSRRITLGSVWLHCPQVPSRLRGRREQLPVAWSCTEDVLLQQLAARDPSGRGLQVSASCRAATLQ
jgi:hypothetical protein